MISQAFLRCGERQERVVDIDLRGVPHDCWSPPWDEEWDMEWSGQLDATTLDRLRQALSAYTHKLRIDNAPRTADRPFAEVTVSDDGIPAFAR